MPYHVNLGLSEDEYATYVRLSEAIQVRTLEKLALVIRHEGGDRYIIQGPEGAPDLRDIVIDLREGTISTPVGETAGAARLAPTARLTGLGLWTGLQWKAAGHDPETQIGWTLHFAIAMQPQFANQNYRFPGEYKVKVKVNPQ